MWPSPFGSRSGRETRGGTGGREYGSDNPEGAINDSIRDACGAYGLSYERGAQKRLSGVINRERHAWDSRRAI